MDLIINIMDSPHSPPSQLRSVSSSPHHQTYDFIIVGAGIAGLYAALLLQEKYGPDVSILILERDHEIGGRANNEMFHGVRLATGAGIGRYSRGADENPEFTDIGSFATPGQQDKAHRDRERQIKDQLLLNLMQTMGFPLQTFPLHVEYGPHIRPLPPDTFAHLKHSFFSSTNPQRKQVSFRAFATKVMGQDAYQRFVDQSGYSDFEDADAEDVFLRYGMEDNFCHDCVGFSVPWRDLVHRMADRIITTQTQTQNQKKNTHLVLGATVQRLLVSPRGGQRAEEDDMTMQVSYTIRRNRYKVRATQQIIVATAVDTLRHLFPDHPIYQQIEGQPFLRVYAKFTPKSARLIQHKVGASGHLVVNPPLQKIITMDAQKGVYMIAYSDNRSARRLRRHVDNKVMFCKLVEDALDIVRGSLEIVDMRAFYWNIGTHYNLPRPIRSRRDFVDEAQHPSDRILVVGEAVSLHQGWVEGALESVVNCI